MTEINYADSSDAPSVDSNDVPSIKSAWDVVKYKITIAVLGGAATGVALLTAMDDAILNRGIAATSFTALTIFNGITTYRSVSDVRKTLSNLPAPKAE